MYKKMNGFVDLENISKAHWDQTTAPPGDSQISFSFPSQGRRPISIPIPNEATSAVTLIAFKSAAED